MKKFAFAVAGLIALSGAAYAESSNVIGEPTLAGQRVEQATVPVDTLRTNSINQAPYVGGAYMDNSGAYMDNGGAYQDDNGFKSQN